MIKYSFLLIPLFSFSSCIKKQVDTPSDLFEREINITDCNYPIADDSLVYVQRMCSNDSYLILFDGHPEKSFSLFNLHSGGYICRFGKIGQGPGEILSGTEGSLTKDNRFVAWNTDSGNISSYNIDSLTLNPDFKSVNLCKYRIENALFSQIYPLSDSLFLGAGVYNSSFQYVLFDKSSKVLDTDVPIFNATDERCLDSHKFLSNQGLLRKHPSRNLFAYIVFNSGNLDIIEIVDKEIKVIKLLRIRNPEYTPVNAEGMYSVNPDIHTPIGYLDVAVGNDYIYALYTDKNWVDGNGEGNRRSSDIVLVFDQTGNPVKKYKLNQEVYNISVNESLNKLYTSCLNSEHGWTITTYNLN